MDSSPIGHLPAEIRNLIYEFALTQPQDVQIYTEPGLLRTCRAIRQEAELMYYSLNNFAIDIHEDAMNHDLCQWLKRKAGARIRSIRGLAVRCEMPSIGINTANSETRTEPEDIENDPHLLGFLHLMHVMSSIRSATFATSLEGIVRFTLNGAKDDESLEKIDGMTMEDQDRYRGAKFLILSLVHGERAVLEAIDASGTRELIEKLDATVRERRLQVSICAISRFR